MQNMGIVFELSPHPSHILGDEAKPGSVLRDYIPESAQGTIFGKIICYVQDKYFTH